MVEEEGKGPFDFSTDELEKLSKKDKNERSEIENEALAESRFTQTLDEDTVKKLKSLIEAVNKAAKRNEEKLKHVNSDL